MIDPSDTKAVQSITGRRSRLEIELHARESVRVILRCEGNEMLADAGPQARKNRKRIRWNTLRIFSGRERPRCLQIVCRSRMALLGQTPSDNAVSNFMREAGQERNR